MKSFRFPHLIMRFLIEVRDELYKIEWPTVDEFIGSTMITLILVVLFSLYFGAVDRGISWIASQIFSAVV